MTSPAQAPDERAWVDVDLAALVTNARTIAAASATSLLPMVKANAYGLGAVRVARALEPLAPWGYGVATVTEGAALRAAGITRPVLVMTPLSAAQVPACLAHALTPVIGDLDALAAWTAAGPRPFHVEIDTGMARSGFVWRDRAAIACLAERLAAAEGWEGIFTHFHSSGDDPAAMRAQWARFAQVLAALPRRPALVHGANSAAIASGAAWNADLVRPGLFLYGAGAGPAEPAPVAALRARVVAVRTLDIGESVGYGATWVAAAPTVIASLAIGYGDGLPRRLGNRAQVEFAGARAPIVGRVSMDLTTIAVPAARVGDVATLFGGLVPIAEQARHAGTIPYELLTALGTRLPRRYHGAGDVPAPPTPRA